MSIQTIQIVTCDLCGAMEQQSSDKAPMNAPLFLPPNWSYRSEYHAGQVQALTHACSKCMADYRKARKKYDKQSEVHFAPFRRRWDMKVLAWKTNGPKPPVPPLVNRAVSVEMNTGRDLREKG